MGRGGRAAVWLCWMVGLCVAARAQEGQRQNPAAMAAPGQASASAAAMPAEPAQLLTLAAKLNGLDSPELKPWHIKATYETFDRKGGPSGTGTYEEWWASDSQYKRSYISQGFTQTDYATQEGLFRVGEQKWAEPPLDLLRSMLLTPFPDPSALSGATIGIEKRSVAGVQLQCVLFAWPIPDSSVAFAGQSPVYCMNATAPVLRIAIYGGYRQAVANGILVFQKHYVARDLEIAENGKPMLKVHVENLETLNATNDFAKHPSDAVAIAAPITLQAKIVQPLVLWKVAPHYPEEAKRLRIQGAVVFNARISTDGRIQELNMKSSPSPLLTGVAEQVVRQWRYTPQRLAGKPADLVTEINIVFSLGN